MNITRDEIRVMIYYDYKRRLSQQECLESLQKTFGDSKPLPILEAPSERSNMKDVLEAHGLVLSPKFRIFFKINQFSSEHMYPIRKINN